MHEIQPHIPERNTNPEIGSTLPPNSQEQVGYLIAMLHRRGKEDAEDILRQHMGL